MADRQALQSPTQGKVLDAGAEITRHLEEIRRSFHGDYRLTFIARNADFPDGSRDVVLTEEQGDVDGALVLLAKEEVQP
jgi:hypothetical protein